MFMMDVGQRRVFTTSPPLRDLVAQPSIPDSNPELELHELWEVHKALVEDNKEEFLRLIKLPRLQEHKDYIGKLALLEAAVKCAAAVLDGETNGIISPDFGYGYTHGQGQLTVMHQVACILRKDMLKLFLERGFSVDVRSDWKRLNYNNLLPLNVALRQLRHLYMKDYWDSQERSAAKLLVELGQRADLLEAVSMLALNTREFKIEFYKYAKAGKIVEVAALLLAAGEKLMPLCLSKGEDLAVFNSFKELSYFLKGKNQSTALSHDDFKEILETLLLLDIYDKIGNQLTPYARPRKDGPRQYAGLEIQSLLLAAGFDVPGEDFVFGHCANISNSSPFESRVSIICAPEELHKVLYKQSQEPSIPTRQLYHTSAFRKIDSKYASWTPAKKVVNVNQNLNSCQKLVPLMKIFRRGVRLV